MKPRPRIEVPSERDDELAVRSLVATSLACLAAGLLLAYSTADRREEGRASHAIEPHQEVEPSANVSAAEPAAPPPPAPPLPAPPPPTAEAATAETATVEKATAELATAAAPTAEVATAVAMPDPPSVEPDAGPEIAATESAPKPENTAPAPAIDVGTPSTTEASPAARKLKIKSGVVAYLRCDGLAQRRGPIPCPRDRALETRMREVIETLPNCREAHAISRGNFEIRLEHIATGAVRDLMVKAPDEASDHAVRACAGAALRKARTELKPTRMIVSMRFKAR